MPSPTPHEWFLPKLTALVAEAEDAGIARDVSVAVVTDLINSPPFNTHALEVNEGWNQDIGEPDALVNVNDPKSAEILETGPVLDRIPYIGRNNAGWV